MRIEYCYENRYLVPADCEKWFERKTDLNEIELVGLEAIAIEFLDSFEWLEFGEHMSAERREAMRSYLRWNNSCVDILDGVYDTYEFDGYLFSSIWMTENGIPMLTAYKIPEDCEDWTEHDWSCEFQPHMFRLN